MLQPDHMLNPYDFVPFEERPETITVDHARIDGLSGGIISTLHTLTPLCIHQNPGQPNRQRVYEFARLGNQPAIPATSLKGMLRGVHEVVTNSTMGLIGSRARHRQRIPNDYSPGWRHERLTYSEALFGMVSGKGEDSVGYAGRLLIDDIPVSATSLRTIEIWRPRGGRPEPDHEPFYFEPGRVGAPLGRKFYYHQDATWLAQFYRRERARASESRMIEVIPEQAEVRDVTIRFFNLREDELAALIYTMQLESALAHKLGFGKPLGLGSVRLTITSLEVERQERGLPARFLDYDDGEEDARPQAGAGTGRFDDWTERIADLVAAAKAAWLARPKGQQSYAAFAAIARWQTQQHYVYPNYDFFQQERRAARKTPLWQYQGRAAYHPGAAATGMEPAQQTIEAAPVEPVSAGSTSTIAPPAEPPPRRQIDLRPIGRVKQRAADDEPFIEGSDGKRYALLLESAPRDVLRRLLALVRGGATPRVRYRPDRQKIEGRNTNVALDVELVEEGTP